MSKYELPSSDHTTIEEPAGAKPGASAGAEGSARERTLGEIIRDTRNLSAEQVERILEYQRSKGLRFGEAAIALGYVKAEDVLSALAQQFNYPYAGPAEKRQHSPELVALNAPFTPQAESFRGLRSQIVMRTDSGQATAPALAVISPGGRDGKTYVAANLAVVLGQLGGRTLLVDANLRAPRQHAVFGLPEGGGLSRVLMGRTDGSVVQQVPGVPNLFLLAGGAPPPNPLELLERPAFALLLREMTSKFDHVVIDTPAAELGSDAAVIAARCGSALVVARKHRSRLDALQALTASLAGSPVKMVGVVTNEY